MIEKRFLSLLLVVGLLLVACSGSSGEQDGDLESPATIHDTAWNIVNYDDGNGNLVDVLDDTEVTANFSQERVDGGTVYGFTGCNEYHGDYNTSPENNIWPGLDLVLTTDKPCSAEIMKQERAFITALINSRQWQIDALEMTFTKSVYDPEIDSNQDAILVTFNYTGEAEAFIAEEDEFVVPEDGIEYSFTFDDDDEGWIVGFSDLPVDYDEAIYELDHDWRALPDDLEGLGIYMQGHNRSDDLFMYLKREIDGLEPNTTYLASFKLDIASNVPPGLSGIGGSPGESVYIKAGASTIEPESEADDQNWYRMNIDKGNQATEGEDMINIGDMANPNLTPDTAGQYELMTVHSGSREFEVSADEDGTLWFIVGTDSGFEGLTSLYYDEITVVFSTK